MIKVVWIMTHYFKHLQLICTTFIYLSFFYTKKNYRTILNGKFKGLRNFFMIMKMLSNKTWKVFLHIFVFLHSKNVLSDEKFEVKYNYHRWNIWQYVAWQNVKNTIIDRNSVVVMLTSVLWNRCSCKSKAFDSTLIIASSYSEKSFFTPTFSPTVLDDPIFFTRISIHSISND